MRPVALLVAAASAALSCEGGGSVERLPDVVLVVLDTVRADRMGCYGGPAGATPRLDALAARAEERAAERAAGLRSAPAPHGGIMYGSRRWRPRMGPLDIFCPSVFEFV